MCAASALLVIVGCAKWMEYRQFGSPSARLGFACLFSKRGQVPAEGFRKEAAQKWGPNDDFDSSSSSAAAAATATAAAVVEVEVEAQSSSDGS